MEVIFSISKFKITINKTRSMINGKMQFLQETFRVTDKTTGETIQLTSNPNLAEVINLLAHQDCELYKLKAI